MINSIKELAFLFIILIITMVLHKMVGFESTVLYVLVMMYCEISGIRDTSNKKEKK